MRKAFEEINKAMMDYTVLVVEDPSKEVLIGSDASELGMGFWRGQVKDEHRSTTSERFVMSQIEIIEYGLVRISPSLIVVRHGIATQRDLRAVIFAIKKCLRHLKGHCQYNQNYMVQGEASSMR